MAGLLLLSFVLQFLGLSYSFTLQPKILNGSISSPEAFPFYVSIGYPKFVCGGSLISDRWVLTAAHCIRQNVTFNLHIGVDSIGRFQQKFTIDTSRQYMYPGHSAQLKSYDIGLIELPHAIDLNGSIQPAILPSNCNEFMEEERVVAAGNGRVNAYLPTNDRILRHGYSEIMYEDECASESGDVDPDSIICAYALNGQHVFSGDSGGPLIRVKDGTLIGITKTMIPLLHNENEVDFQIFTRISYHFDWISHKTGLILPKCEKQGPIYE